MIRIVRLLSTAFALVAFAITAAADGTPPPTKNKRFLEVVPTASVRVEPAQAKRGQTVQWTLTLDISPGWYTYPTIQPAQAAASSVTSFTFPPASDVVFVDTLQEPIPHIKNLDGLSGIPGKTTEVLILEGKVVFQRPLVVSPDAQPGEKKIEVTAEVIVCNANGVCLLPTELNFVVPLTVTADPPVPVEAKYQKEIQARKRTGPSPEPTRSNGEPKAIAKPDKSDDPPSAGGERKSDDGLLAFILSGMFWGAVSLLTPCVFPMIPITVSFFLKQSEKEHHRPLAMALVYSATIVIVLTVGAVLLLSVFQAASQHWATNFILGGLFVFFALSLFGMYEITLPSGLANFTSTQQGRGGMMGTIFMALTFSIISFSCVAPFMGGFAALVPSYGSVSTMIHAGEYGALFNLFGRLLLGALAFSVTFASPFFFLALFPSLLRKMPKSGSWMNTVKVVMGFLEIAAAIKFLRAAELLMFGQAQFLTYDLALGMYVALSIACGLYLLGLFRLPHDDPPEHVGVPRLIVSVLFLSLGIYLVPALFRINADQKQRPTGTVFAWLDSFLLPDVQERRLGSLAEGLKEARDKRKLVFIDFTGIS
jgi:thiol:disulfide interchange protein DsbD